ncbi:MAG: Z1 domain-containing protein, partial [Ornithinimicrobium sp.]
MGSVQSGKTASMFGVSARALDEGVDVVVILAGTRISLWQQTLDRFASQVDWPTEGAERERARLLIPKSGVVIDNRVALATLYRLQSASVRRALRERRPIVVIAMKQVDHLRALARSLRESVVPAIETADRPVHMLVLDDEADDGSVLDAVVENSQDAADAHLKQIPRAIADLWEPRAGRVSPPNLFTTYVAYTATPQANFLQEDHNPLAPKDFVVALRTPFDRGAVVERSTTYFEPEGPDRYYTGGETFYRRAHSAGLAQRISEDPKADTLAAMRSFLVGAAIRVLREPHRMGPATARHALFRSREEAGASCPLPTSMLVHPSASVSDHFGTLGDVISWAGANPPEDVAEWHALAAEVLPGWWAKDLIDEEGSWQAWREHFATSAAALKAAFNTPQARSLPSWAAIRAVLLEEIFPGTRISVVNSDPNADDRPEYEPKESGEGWLAPRDMSTIFISGNVMSRGLTLEGLTTTLFMRRTDSPYADTQMQMQRWFGYRGSYLELCRLFASSEQLQLFASYHDADEALRQQVIAEMASNAGPPTPQVLQGANYIATGKIANVRTLPLCPGASPFIRSINTGQSPDPNAELVAKAFVEHPSSEVLGRGSMSRGRILDRPLTLAETAELLDELSFDAYRPGQDSWQSERWEQVRKQLEAQGPLPDARPLYRAPGRLGAVDDLARRDCSYAIPAYLRLWEAALSRHVRGMAPTDGPARPWSMVGLAARRQRQPRFWVGIRYGAGSQVSDGPLANLPFEIRAAQR